MKTLFAILDEGDDAHVAEIGRHLDAAGFRGPDAAVVLHFSRTPATDGPRAPGENVRLETIVSGGRLGYGEQVKLAFGLAERLGCDAVVTLDGKPRYPVEEIPTLLAPLTDGAALALAIPAGETKLVRAGSWLASRLINFLTSTRLSAWHTGFRAYRVAALAGIPYAKNRDDRGFNTEILIQLLIAGRDIAQVDVRHYPHAPLSFLAKCRFCMAMFQTAGLSLLHQCSLFYQPQFDLGEPLDAYGLKLGYRSSHTLTLATVPAGARVLDIGCGNGAFDRLLVERGCQVHGLDQHQAADIHGLDAYTRIDLDVRDHVFPVRGYDAILLLDILEHLRYPENLLAYLRANSGPDKPDVLISVPNVAFFIIRLRLLCGSFQYGKLGILDLTHTRLYSEASIVSLLERNGYAVRAVEGIPAPYPKAIGLGVVSRCLLACNGWLIRCNRRVFAYQFFIHARPKPTLRDLLPEEAASPRALP